MTAAPDQTHAGQDAACDAVSSEIARTDGKASLLLAFDGAILAGLASLADANLPPLAQLFGGAAVAALTAAAVLLLLVVRPALGGRGRLPQEGFPRWAQLDEDELRAALREDTRLLRIKTLSTLAVRKYERLARAVDTILLALALLAAAALAAAA